VRRMNSGRGNVFRLQEQRDCPQQSSYEQIVFKALVLQTQLGREGPFRLQERRDCPQGWAVLHASLGHG